MLTNISHHELLVIPDQVRLWLQNQSVTKQARVGLITYEFTLSAVIKKCLCLCFSFFSTV